MADDEEFIVLYQKPLETKSLSVSVRPSLRARCFFAVLLLSAFGMSAAAVVPVKVMGTQQTSLLVVPNPSSPSAMHEMPGEFYFSNQPNARNWVRVDNRGIVISFMVGPQNYSFTESSLKIYDSYGTAVATAGGSIVIPASWTAASNTYDYDVYRNGTKTNGEFVHEGIYTAELKYTLTGSTDPVVLTGAFYMEQPGAADTLYSNVKKNVCGTGYALALIPAIGIRLRRPLLAAFRKKSGRQS